MFGKKRCLDCGKPFRGVGRVCHKCLELLPEIEVDMSEPEPDDFSGLVLMNEEAASLGPVPMPEPAELEASELLRLLTDQLCDLGEAYAVEVWEDGFTIYSGNDAINFKHTAEDVEAAIRWVSAELIKLRQRVMPFHSFAGAAMEEIGSTLYRAGRDPYAADANEAREVLRTLSLSRVLGREQVRKMASRLERKVLAEYQSRLLHEIALRWPVFQFDAQNGEI